MAKTRLDLTDERQSPYKVILLLAWPLFVEQILATMVSFVDNAMVGSLGASASASISISNSFVFLINGAVMALGVGLTTYVARSVGAKDYEAAKAYIRHAIIVLAMVGVPLALLTFALHKQIPVWMGAGEDYLAEAQGYLQITSAFRIFTMMMMVLGSVYRGRGDTKTPLKINVTVNLLNVVGNYLLIHAPHNVNLFGKEIWIWGADMGVRGAALSTGISWFLGGTFLLLMLFIKDDPTRISLKESYKPDWKLLGRVVSISIPAMLERISMSLSGIVVTKSIATLGMHAVAANGVYGTAESLSFMPGFAFQTAATTLVGQSLGAKKPDLARRYVKCSMIFGCAVMGFAGAMLFIFARPLVSIINPDPNVIAIAKNCLRVVAFIQPIQIIAWIYAGAMRGAGDTKWAFYITAFTNWTFRALGVVILINVLRIATGESNPMHLPFAVACMCLDQGARAILMYMSYRSGRWINVLNGINDAFSFARFKAAPFRYLKNFVVEGLTKAK